MIASGHTEYCVPVGECYLQGRSVVYINPNRMDRPMLYYSDTSWRVQVGDIEDWKDYVSSERATED